MPPARLCRHCLRPADRCRRPADRDERARANVALPAPAPASARSIVSTLWAKRERALAASDAAALAQVESFSAQQQDNAVITMRKEKWGHRRDPHPAMRVVVHVPARSVQPAFFASVRTTNVRSGSASLVRRGGAADRRGLEDRIHRAGRLQGRSATAAEQECARLYPGA